MWLDPSSKNTAKPLGIAWPANSIQALGINFLNNDEIVYHKNLENERLPYLWYPRNLSLYHIIMILKSLAISKLIYNTSVLTFPSKLNTMVNQAIAQFVWNKKAKIKCRTKIGPKEQGDPDMLDFQIISDAL